ncbi:tRNA uridine-5-carboxymethylaminomethyl(34) synthesis enzyme MnmG [Metamycoplasma hyosynoviae]|uniref:tRNA uridine 5-carboxymethylaminomethyl modification enzyme MnmG n=1 Tax=Metamycoplasma hyosynoviae TaxID=29559 RepID=A0A4P1QGQ2_9BACT|nr:tRNA uridine-5-carboxymethylaminomethyl(34) synthesis enzyme MnmG [Metamycoplasma hyosynoviae]ASI54164.1 glucose-inhibited division protein A [Metamycoplasma hyosynoviae]MDC8900221.1 tRNA uridine-5-carboxymethylaminomethyl(34) synthesis enzyme MnmG [Metamycoplasma hyosynoviae]MDD1358638.1 tRNA uridine-5-carboxymethylaminomethyl(34) synthesis enzyme MnmG [Metamycoplasma hyosynoviae]MDD1360811.1 tRNA uridine-5-carboxymethylaminomethyl(34) synthesis enzyme MnmG [Metamycoplasma hyosynoviae]MDD1
MNNFKAIVIGGGHAGIEAAYALSKRGFSTVLITLNLNKLAMLPCNPSIGGSAKGIITREIDGLGGMQGYFADKAMIQIKMLNSSKGPSVWSLRAQIDKEKYCKIILEDIKKQKNITLEENEVEDLIVKDDKCIGVKCADGKEFYADVTIMTTGVYMNCRILRGSDIQYEGPDKEKRSIRLSENLKKYGFEIIRLKTGTPCRIYTDSIDFSKVEKEILEENELFFSPRSGIKLDKQTCCYLTHSTEETKKIVQENIGRSSLYSGIITGIGPRYCPSFEDKIVRFPEKLSHHIFFEPETNEGDIMYINGLSTSMPIDVQDKMIRSIPGLENARVQKYGYAIEYDAINPLALYKSLESKTLANFYSAGQPNGTSGYEEAAAQGLIAGINAANKLEGKAIMEISRSDAYIGVLIDDIVTKGTNEPYRMLTSRAEYRLLLRNDNIDQRLYKYAYKNKMISRKEYLEVKAKYELIDKTIEKLKNEYVSSTSKVGKKYNCVNGISKLKLLANPEVDPLDVLDEDFPYKNELTIQVRLYGYLQKQKSMADKMNHLEKLKLSPSIDYYQIPNIATEAKQKLSAIKPSTIGQASRISGINPADIQMLIYWLNNKKTNEN